MHTTNLLVGVDSLFCLLPLEHRLFLGALESRKSLS